jgi:hypothetical protein
MHNLAIEIRELKARALKVSERRLRYRVEAAFGGASDAYAAGRSSPDHNYLERQLPALNIDECRLVGVTEKTESVIKLLEDGNSSRLKVVPIVGFGGLGKTTLAVTVYKSPTMKGIQTRAFLTVSQHYDLRILLESLLRQLIQISLSDRTCSREEAFKDPLRGIETWDISEIIGRCRAHLEDKRYFLAILRNISFKYMFIVLVLHSPFKIPSVDFCSQTWHRPFFLPPSISTDNLILILMYQK